MESKISKNLLGFDLRILESRKFVFILISAAISGLGFVKSYFFLKLFGFTELGFINICQNVIISVSLLQFGMITGGYRFYCYKSKNILGKINSAVFFFFVIIFLLLVVVFLSCFFFFNLKISHYLLSFSLLTGVVSLYANWVNCKLLAIKSLKVLNAANLLSTIISLSLLLLFRYIGVWSALFTFLTQSSILIIVAYTSEPQLRPKLQPIYFRKLSFKIISVGFVPYLTSAMGFFNSQLGRWLITATLGTLILGKTSLVNLYVTLINVFPAAISNLFFPTLIAKYESDSFEEFKMSLKRYFLILIIYISCAVVITILLSKVVISILFPKHLESLQYVYAILPSLAFLCLVNPIVIVLNADKRFKEIFYGSFISILVYVCFLLVYLNLFEVRLIGFFIIESISSLSFFLYNCYVFRLVLRKLHHE